MPKCICKESLLRELTGFESDGISIPHDCEVTPEIAAKGMLVAVIRTVEQMSEAPVAPVKGGKWKVHKKDPLDIYVHTCDVCEVELLEWQRVDRKYSYCPFCGAALEAAPQEDPKED